MTADSFNQHFVATEFPEEKPVKLTPTSIEEIRAKKGRAAPDAGLDSKTPKDQVAQLADRVAQLEAEVGPGEVTQQDLAELASQIRDLNARLDSIMSALQATVGYGARHNFVCRNCQSRGSVAARLNCTSCGEENWWGWWPQKGQVPGE